MKDLSILCVNKSNTKNKQITLNLFDGVYQNNIEKIQEAINNGADINAVRSDNENEIGLIEYLIKSIRG